MDWQELFEILVKFFCAVAFSLPIAWEREKSTRIMGLRTFPLVAVSSCAYLLVGMTIVGENSDELARLLQGLMSGIGFIGGGAILKEGVTVRGTATAASIWTTGAVGAAVAYGRYEIGLIVSGINFLVLLLLTPIERQLGKSDQPQNAEGGEEEDS
ncbi:MgtC/SapB family protein [Oscillatoria acuminata]|uniref:Putative membrane protein n=1 Tax=Oscillatoria acuminata PCC 6304 TaxID=56110 RepID=K9THB2_9CYAN|nr:MgtC/SapB family protein [Oscillatoria acuminata]AFY81935.1 putative membrane protein [Oscillatoria acuminata PCC 6304]